MFTVRKAVGLSLLAASLCGVTGCKRVLPAPSLDPTALTVVCLGDSITAGTHSTDDNGQLSYPLLLDKILAAYRPSVQVVNEGQDGWQIDDIALHVQAWLAPAQPDIILLQIGTNDLEQGALPGAAAKKLDLLITQIQQIAPKSHLYIASCTKVRDDNRPKLAPSVLEQYNNAILKIVKAHEGHGHFAVFVDLFKHAGFVNSDLGPDGEHPTDSGYQKMADYWAWELQRHEAGSLHQTITKKEVTNEQ
jgi:lysophospholipase L1-like esterase